jgi:hypothetical protein
MKYIPYILLIVMFANCDSENAPDCLQTAGGIIETEVVVASFTKVLVWDQIQLFVSQGDTQNIRVETGANLFPDIEFVVIDGQVNIYNNNQCNLIRDYGITKVFITAPNITEIRSSSSLPIIGIGLLQFPELTLISEDEGVPGITHTVGDFDLTLDVTKISIIANGLSRFYLKGRAINATFSFYGGNGAVTAPNLIIEHATVFHRGSADWILYPEQSIRGSIVSVGNIICKNEPPIIKVDAPYQGQLIVE